MATENPTATFTLISVGGGSCDDWYPLPVIDTTEHGGTRCYDRIDSIVYDISPFQGWYQYGSDEKNTFYTIYDAPTTNTPADKWQVTSLSNHNFAGLVVGTGNNIYASLSPRHQGQSYHPGVWIINQYGEVVEKYYIANEDESVSYPVENSKGEVFVATGGGAVYRIDTKGKSVVNIFEDASGGELETPKVDSDNYLYVGSDDNLWCLNPDGTPRWPSPFQPGSGRKMWRGIPAIDEIRNSVYIGYYEESTEKSYLACVNRGNGILRYEKEWSNITVASRMTGVASVASDGTVYVGCYNTLYALTPGTTSFTEKWHRDTNSIMTSAPTIGQDGTLYVAYWKNVGSDWWYLFNALNPANGIDKWASPIEIPSLGDYDNVLQPYATSNNVVVFSWNS